MLRSNPFVRWPVGLSFVAPFDGAYCTHCINRLDNCLSFCVTDRRRRYNPQAACYCGCGKSSFVRQLGRECDYPLALAIDAAAACLVPAAAASVTKWLASVCLTTIVIAGLCNYIDWL